MNNTLLLAIVAGCAAIGASASPAGASTTAAKARTFANCTEMHKVYPHGVGRRGASQKGGPLTGHWYVSNALYEANVKSDRDKDGIACEK
jgi:hypothetical protein